MEDFIKTGLFLLILLLFIGCNTVEDNSLTKTTNENNNTLAISNQEEKPLALKLTIGEEEIKTYRGTYSWSYKDKVTGQNVMIEADHASPIEMVNINEGIKVDLNEPVKLNFEIEPTKLEVRVWDNKTTISTYNSFEKIEEKGKYIIEIVGYWGDSRATYVVALDIH